MSATLPSAVSLIDPFPTGHHVSYAAWLAGGLLAHGVRVQLIGPHAWLDGVTSTPGLGSGHLALRPLDIFPEGLEPYFALPTLQRERYAVRFMRAAGQAAQAFGSDVAHLLWLDRFMLPLLAAWPAYRGLNVQATLHWPTFLPPFQPQERSARWRARAEGLAVRQLQARGLHLQVHSQHVATRLGATRGRATGVPYPTPPEAVTEAEITAAQQLRRDLGLRAGDRLLLAFGGTRHDKGADLAARLLPQLPEHVHLLVAGRAQSFGAELLRELAGPAAGRLHLQLEFVPEERTRPIFLAADALLLPYRTVFAGQSGPLTIAASLGVPVAAADVGMLAETVQAYELGTVFAAENLDEMARAVTRLLAEPPRLDPAAFRQDHAPEAFVQAVLAAYRYGASAVTRATPVTSEHSSRSGMQKG